ncbi:MAG: transposase [Elusimicrobia bacterium]|nr:transposase [Elusimicrobiota bacterium]
MKKEFRKSLRLKNYDYSQDGYYFVTITTHNRLPILCSGGCKPAIEECIKHLPQFIKGLELDYFVVMDNHIHVIFIFENCARSLGQIVKALKYNITKIVAGGLPTAKNVATRLPSRESSHGNATATGKGIWQWNYYEHVIRNEKALMKIREYIQNNPEKEILKFEEFYE